MDDFVFGLFCAATGLAVPVLLASVALFVALHARGRVAELERRLRELEARGVPARPAVAAVTPAPAPVVPAAPPAVRAPASAPLPGPPPEDGGRERAASAPLPGPEDGGRERAAPPPAPKPPPPAKPSRPLEALGVWALAIPGGLALLLAALFALREAIAAGLVGPGVRFALGAAAGTGALLGSELARWRRYDVPAAALGGAGAGIFYAVLYAGYARYGLLGQEVAFVAMIATTAITLLAAERRDSQFMATLAMVGGYLTPILLSTGENKAVAFFTYIALLDAGLLLAAARRRWAVLSALAGLVTTALYLGWMIRFRAPDQEIVGLAAPAVLAGLFFTLPGRRSSSPAMAWVGHLAGLLLLLVAFPFLVPGDPLRTDPISGIHFPVTDGALDWFPLAWLALATFAPVRIGARRGDRGMEGVAVLVSSALLAVFTFGHVLPDPGQWPLVALSLAVAGPLVALAGSPFWCVTAFVASALFALASAPEPPPIPVLAGFVGASAVLSSAISHARGPRWALVIGVVACVLPLLPPLPEEIARPDLPYYFVAAATAYAAFAFPPFWRPRAGDLPGALSAALAAPLFFFPFREVWVDALGDGWIGVLPVILGLCALVAAVSLVRAVRVRADDRELAILVIVVLLAAAVAVPLQLSEAWLTVGWAVEVALLGVLSRRLTHPTVRVFAGVLAVAVAVRLLLNPDALAYGGGEGWIVLNWTLYTWGVPAVCMLIAGHFFGDPPWFRAALRTLAVFLFFALVNLEVAHAFAHGQVLSFTSADLAESMTRSISWAACGLVLIGVGMVRDARGARLAGLCFALLGAAKVFVVDLWHLSGFVRVGSFAGLAITLLVGAIAFQRIVLKDRKP